MAGNAGEAAVLAVVRLGLHAVAAVEHLGQSPGVGGPRFVHLQGDVAVQRLDGQAIGAEPGPQQAEVVPGRSVVGLRAGQLLEGAGGVGQLAGGGARKRPLPGGLSLRRGGGGQALEGVFPAGDLRQAPPLAEILVHPLAERFVGRVVLNGHLQGGAGRQRAVQLGLAVGDGGVHLSQDVTCVGVIQLGGLAEELQRAGDFALELAELAAQQVAERVVGADGEGLLQGLLGLVGAVHLEEHLGLTAERLGVGRVLGDYLVQGTQGGVVLAGLVLEDGLGDLGGDGLTAPLEFFAAATRTGGIGVGRHAARRGWSGPEGA